jgi:hypothetical protein
MWNMNTLNILYLTYSLRDSPTKIEIYSILTHVGNHTKNKLVLNLASFKIKAPFKGNLYNRILP